MEAGPCPGCSRDAADAAAGGEARAATVLAAVTPPLGPPTCLDKAAGPPLLALADAPAEVMHAWQGGRAGWQLECCAKQRAVLSNARQARATSGAQPAATSGLRALSRSQAPTLASCGTRIPTDTTTAPTHTAPTASHRGSQSAAWPAGAVRPSGRKARCSQRRPPLACHGSSAHQKAPAWCLKRKRQLAVGWVGVVGW